MLLIAIFVNEYVCRKAAWARRRMGIQVVLGFVRGIDSALYVVVPL